MRWKALIPATLALCAVSADALTQDPAEPPATPAETDVLSFEPNGELMAVPVTVLGQGPYAFLVDSGSERTVIAKELARRLALQPGKNVRVHSTTEASTLATARIPHLQISKRRVSDIEAPAIPAEHIGAAGVLGVDTLRRQRVEFDFTRRTMTISSSTNRVTPPAPNTITVAAKSRYGRLVITNMRIDGEDVIAVIDTGSEVSLANRALQLRLARRNRLRPTIPIIVTSITGGSLPVDYTQLKRMSVNGLDVTNMPIGFATSHIFKQLRLEETPAVMLGMDALRLFAKVSVDFARKEVRFELPGPANRTALR